MRPSNNILLLSEEDNKPPKKDTDTPWENGLTAKDVFGFIPGSARYQEIHEMCKSAELVSLQAVKPAQD